MGLSRAALLRAASRDGLVLWYVAVKACHPRKEGRGMVQATTDGDDRFSQSAREHRLVSSQKRMARKSPDAKPMACPGACRAYVGGSQCATIGSRP